MRPDGGPYDHLVITRRMPAVARRRARGGDPSHVTPEVARALAADEQAWAWPTDLDTSQPGAVVVRAALAVIDGVDQHA